MVDLEKIGYRGSNLLYRCIFMLAGTYPVPFFPFNDNKKRTEEPCHIRGDAIFAIELICDALDKCEKLELIARTNEAVKAVDLLQDREGSGRID